MIRIIHKFNYNMKMSSITFTNIGELISNSRLDSGSVRYTSISTRTESPSFMLKLYVGEEPSAIRKKDPLIKINHQLMQNILTY